MGGRQQTVPPGAAAADHLGHLLRGPEHSGEVVAVRTHAALAAISTGAGTRLIAIGTPAGSTRTANTVLLAAGRPPMGMRVRVGDGALLLGDRRHPILRYWPSGITAHPIAPAAVGELRTPMSLGITGLDPATVEPLLDALRSGSAVGPAARSLVGRGPGSTPAGDDVLAGVALGLRVSAQWGLLASLTAAIAPDLHERTSALSANLLDAALAGHVSTEVRALVLALRPGVTRQHRRCAVEAVLGLGHTSGADLLLGLGGALRIAPSSPPHSPPPAPNPTLPQQSRRMAAR